MTLCDVLSVNIAYHLEIYDFFIALCDSVCKNSQSFTHKLEMIFSGQSQPREQGITTLKYSQAMVGINIR